MEPTQSSSPFYKSKTFWVNLAALLSLVSPDIKGWLVTNPVEFVAFLTAANLILKFFTHKLSKTGAQHDSPEATRSEVEPGVSTSSGSDPCPGVVDTIKMSSIGLLTFFCFGAVAACGHRVNYDGEEGLTISKDGVIVTITKPSHPTRVIPGK